MQVGLWVVRELDQRSSGKIDVADNKPPIGAPSGAYANRFMLKQRNDIGDWLPTLRMVAVHRLERSATEHA